MVLEFLPDFSTNHLVGCILKIALRKSADMIYFRIIGLEPQYGLKEIESLPV